MELKNVKQIETLIDKGIKLYAICPFVNFNGKIQYNKVYEIIGKFNYTYSLNIVTKPTREFAIFRSKRGWVDYEKINDTDEINTKARVFASKEDATKALEDEVKLMSYEAIKCIDRQLKIIEECREKLNKREEKYLALKKQYYETSVKRFSK